MRRLMIVTAILLGLLVIDETQARAMSRANFLNQISTGAQQNWQQYGILPSVTAAQAILESGWGTSQLSTSAHNLFGIKGVYADGGTVQMPTREVFNGRSMMIWSNFRAYPTLSDSVADHGRFIANNSRYRNVLGERNPWVAVQKLQQDGYATDPAYASELMQIIQNNQLMIWDNGTGLHQPFDNRPNGIHENTIVRLRPQIRRYVIQPGDSWWRIGQAAGLSMQTISQTSKTPIRWWIYPGQWLWMVQPRNYIVQPHDTWQRIERAWQLAPGSLATANGYSVHHRLKVGMKLELPFAA
ncbi:MAG TPA: hypothetical protein DCW31_02815 [Lactobacillus sp.]|nr:hypothetical protein [Lactobacillus sp.]